MPLTTTSPRIHYDLYGQAGPEVVLVMGFGMRGRIWKPQTDDLSRDHRLVTMDHRGLGDSPDPPTGPLTMRELASDVARVIDAARFVRPHLVGVSMGGMIAQELAVTNPEAFRSLTLIATHPGRSLTALPSLPAIRDFARSFSSSPAARREAFFALLYTPEFVASADKDALMTRAKEQMGSAARREVLLAELAAIARHDVTKRLGRLRSLPTLLVRPDRDRLVRPVGIDRIAALVPHARLVRFADAAHGVTFQKASELNQVLREFFAEND